MRILRSQYLKYKAQQGLEATTTGSKTTTLTSVHDETQVHHTTSEKANGDLKSIQTVKQTTRTTIHRNSIAPHKDTSSRTLFRRNSSCPLNDTTPLEVDNFLTSLPSGQVKIISKYLDTAYQPPAIQQRRQTVACTNADELLKQQILNALKIKLLNTPCGQYTRINLVVRFYDEGASWYTRFYRSYQNTLWLKLPRTDSGNKKLRWYFKCEVCQKKLCSFTTLKSHLNIHMKFFPHRCEVCPKEYAARSTLIRHKKTKHVFV